MKKLLVATTIASLVLAAPAARANEWGGLAAGLAGGTHRRRDRLLDAAASHGLRAG